MRVSTKGIDAEVTRNTIAVLLESLLLQHGHRRSVTALRRRHGGRPAHLWEIGRAFARGHALTSAAGKDEDHEIRGYLARSALSHLGQALEAGFEKRERLEDDASFDSLRPHPEFDRLLK